MIHVLRLTVLAVALVLGGCGRKQPQADGHDHASDDAHVSDDQSEDVVATVDAHAEDELGHVELTPEQSRQLNVEFATAGPGTIGMDVTFPGEIIANEDRMVHIVPRAGGIVREVKTSLGEHVEAGQALAWIESGELAQAKLDFFSARAEVGCCQIELPRALEILETTHKMLAILDDDLGVDELQQFDDAEMGEFRGALVTAYAEYLAAGKAFERERTLLAKNIASESDYIEAESAFKKAQAAFTAGKDIARYQSLVQYTEAARKRQVAEFEAVSAEQQLRLLGVEGGVIERLVTLVPQAAGLEPCLCDDPNCGHGEIPSILETLGTDERLGWYALRAPISGYVTTKHMTLGEKVNADASVMAVVDTSSVWVRFSVYQKDLHSIRTGQAVRVDPGLNLPEVRGTIQYVSPVIDPQTRTAQARLALPNPEGVLRPGLYVQVHVDVGSTESPVVIAKDAVQILDERNVVFVREGEDFVAVPVELGRSDHATVVVLSGLEAGERYVRRGAFELKAKIVTSGLGSHAGHGH
ncbi:MAG: efflux RND transporter periplasmic adaptor subunit [Planctomycetes bacterium]|nr:efflux RND transporter periplasmic adaptor subunit [Planctomycetota bacterium]